MIATIHNDRAFANPNPFNGSKLVSTLAIACIYIISARAGQLFAIEPANVTPVWIPSGIMLALALKYGSRVWPGVFVGAFLGNIWAYIDFHAVTTILTSIGSATLNGIGDVICVVGAARLIREYAGTPRVLEHYAPLAFFIVFGAILGPLVSAVMGVGGLWAFGYIEANLFSSVLMTWWIGDGVGVILFTPFILSWLYAERAFNISAIVAIAVCSIYSVALTSIALGYTELPWELEFGAFLFMPFLFSAMFHFGQRLVFTIQVNVVGAAVILTWFGFGPFANQPDPNTGLIQLQIFSAAFSLVLFTIAILNLEKSLNERYLEQHTKKLEELYRKDPLTNSWNRYRLREFVLGELDRFSRGGPSFGVILFDLDDFKQVNDKHGHIVGDDVLINIARVMQSRIRNVDFFGRWGGEEFIVIIHDADRTTLQKIADNLLEIVRSLTLPEVGKVTISIGGTIVKTEDNEMTVIDRADNALYQAKAQGKDCAAFI